MASRINLPISQVRLTNVAVVRYNYQGQRFEIACYKNKVLDYRSGNETDLSEVLQTDRIFTNVSKGRFAKTADLRAAFGTTDEETIARTILDKGSSLQVSSLEREQVAENAASQIATWVASHCVHPQTGRPYTVSQIRHALGKNYQVQPHKALKKQYLDAVKFLKQSGQIPIERAKMELSLRYPARFRSQVESAFAGFDPPPSIVKEEDNKGSGGTAAVSGDSVKNDGDDNDDDGVMVSVVLRADPALYRELNELAKRVEGRLEIRLQQVAAAQVGDVDLEEEVERKKLQHQQQLQQQQQQQQQLSSGPAASEDEEVGQLAEKLEAVRIKAAAGAGSEKNDNANGAAGGYGEVDDDDEDDEVPAATSRQNQKKAQKKKKKAAKRRQQQEELDEEGDEDDDEDDDEDEQQAGGNTSRKGNGSETKQQQRKPETTPSPTPRPAAAGVVVGGQQQGGDSTGAAGDAKSCNTCGGSFLTAAEYRAHFRGDWHRFNQKLKLKGVSAVSLEEFKLCDAEAFFGQDS